MELQMPQQPRCAICFTTEKLLRCAKCKSAFYCSVSHQHMDWPTHKITCRNINSNRLLAKQLTHAITATGTLGNMQAPPTTTFPLATAATYANSNITIPQQQMTLNNVNGISYNIVDDTANYINSSANQSSNPPIMSVIQGANENTILSSQLNLNMLVDPPMDQIQTFYMDANTHTLNLHSNANASHQVLTTLQQTTEFSPQYHIMQQSPEYQMEQEQQPPPHQQPPQTYAHFRNQNSQHEKSSSYQIGQGDENVMANFNERRYEELCRNIINDMNEYGLSVVDDFLGVEKGMEILGEVHNMYCAGVFQDGQLVNNRKTEQELNKTIRGDKITWVKGVESGCTSVGYLINQIDAVICRANTMKNNGKLGNYNIKERTKAMVACYPGSGTQYVTHVDNPNKDGRVITAIYYLNVDWDAKKSGGVLRIFPEATNTIADIEPKFDRLIFFWSDKRNPHEVQPSHRTRYAITVWYFDANEREAALNRCKYGNLAKNTTDSSTSKNNVHHKNSSDSKNSSNNSSHLTAEFSKANENSNPNLNSNFNANTATTTTATTQMQRHKSEICT